MTRNAHEIVFCGTPASGDVAVGRLAILGSAEAGDRVAGGVPEEHALLRSAVDAADRELRALAEAEDELAADILEFQMALLGDDDLLDPVRALIDDGAPCHVAWKTILDGEAEAYRAGGDDYMAARADDLIDMAQRVARHMVNGSGSATPIEPGSILVADNLTPSQFLEQDWSRLTGAAVRGSSPTSHVAILARARDVTLIVGLDADLAVLESGAEAIIDGRRGTLTQAPSPATLEEARARIARYSEDRQRAAALIDKPAVTADGTPVRILVNVDDPAALAGIDPAICDGIGLTRTEFLFADGRLPDEETQLQTYLRVLAWADGRPVTIRTLDAGGDKPIAGVTINGEANPFLGVRGVRLSLANPDLFRTQLRALLRASAFGDLKIMVPMVSVPAELAAVRELLDEVASALDAEGIRHGAPKLGMMIEVPAAALTAEAFDADFYSIGTNDLIQYTLAAARDNAAVSGLADGANPAVLELIRRTVDAAAARGVEVSICGDMAAIPEHNAALLDCGLRVLSVAPAQVGKVKLAVSRHRLDAVDSPA